MLDIAKCLARCLLVAVVGSCGGGVSRATPDTGGTALPTAARSEAPSPLATEAASPTPPDPTTAVQPVPRPAPTTPLPATPAPPSPAHNEGQAVRVTLPRGYEISVGEAGGAPLVLDGRSWTLNGARLSGADIRCTDLGRAGLCVGVRIIDGPALLVNGRSYDLALAGELIARFTAGGLVRTTPHVVSVRATQYSLVVAFDRPMAHAGDCGGTSWSFLIPGTVEHIRDAGLVFPAAPASYRSADAGYQDVLTAFVSEAQLSDDCRTVTFGSGWGAPVGVFDVTVADVADVDGNLVEPRTARVTIADEGPPSLRFAQLELQTAERKVIRVAYSEAMDEISVTDADRYLLNGKPLPAGTTIACELADCAWVRLTFAPTVFVYGADNALTIVGVVDMAGKAMVPDIVTSGAFQVR